MAAQTQQQRLQSVSEAFSVIDTFLSEEPELTYTRLSQELRISASLAQRLLASYADEKEVNCSLLVGIRQSVDVVQYKEVNQNELEDLLASTPSESIESVSVLSVWRTPQDSCALWSAEMSYNLSQLKDSKTNQPVWIPQYATYPWSRSSNCLLRSSVSQRSSASPCNSSDKAKPSVTSSKPQVLNRNSPLPSTSPPQSTVSQTCPESLHDTPAALTPVSQPPPSLLSSSVSAQRPSAQLSNKAVQSKKAFSSLEPSSDKKVASSSWKSKFAESDARQACPSPKSSPISSDSLKPGRPVTPLYPSPSIRSVKHDSIEHQSAEHPLPTLLESSFHATFALHDEADKFASVDSCNDDEMLPYQRRKKRLRIASDDSDDEMENIHQTKKGKSEGDVKDSHQEKKDKTIDENKVSDQAKRGKTVDETKSSRQTKKNKIGDKKSKSFDSDAFRDHFAFKSNSELRREAQGEESQMPSDGPKTYTVKTKVSVQKESKKGKYTVLETVDEIQTTTRAVSDVAPASNSLFNTSDEVPSKRQASLLKFFKKQ